MSDVKITEFKDGIANFANLIAEKGTPRALLDIRTVGPRMAADALASLTKEGLIAKDFVQAGIKTNDTLLAYYNAKLMRRGIPA